MGIKSRFVPQGADVSDRYTLPESIFNLFEKAPAFGRVFPRRQLYENIVPFFEEYEVEHKGLLYSLRPAWTSYYSSPRTHVIITGHILFCHTITGRGWYDQPSVHLFQEDARTRAAELDRLTRRALRRRV